MIIQTILSGHSYFKERDMVESAGQKKTKANRKEQIMEAAMKLFAEKGFERSTTKAIAAKAGVAEGTIFIYFPTKRDLLIACVRQEIVEPLTEIFKDECASDEDIIRAFFINRLGLLRKHFGMFKLMLSEGLFNTDLRKEFFERIFSPGLAEVVGYITRRMEAGKFKRLDPVMVAKSLVGQVISNLWVLIIFGKEPDEVLNENLANTLTTIFLDGVRA